MTGSGHVYGVGQCALDHLALMSTYPEADAKAEFDQLEIQGGGPVATALVALSRWGVSCRFAGVIGDDNFGEAIRQSLEMENIDTTGLQVRENACSQFAFIAIDGTGRRTIFWRRPSGPPLTAAELDPDAIRTARLLHTDGLMIDASLAAARLAREAGVTVVVDAGTLREGMLELASQSDHFIASEKFGQALVGADDPEQACRQIVALGPAVAAVTLGDRGYVALDRGTLIRGAAQPAHTIDTTGCGDVFHAGYIYGLLQGWDPTRSLTGAARAAARVSEQLGGRAGIPALNDWLDR